MHREIKFRARLKTGEWIYWRVDEELAPRYTREAIDWDTLGQFTGLVDKDGTDIYEDDILQPDDHPRPLLVLYRAAQFMLERKMHPNFGDKDYGWVTADLTDWHGYYGADDVPGAKIIGNYYDNRNLLEN